MARDLVYGIIGENRSGKSTQAKTLQKAVGGETKARRE